MGVAPLALPVSSVRADRDTDRERQGGKDRPRPHLSTEGARDFLSDRGLMREREREREAETNADGEDEKQPRVAWLHFVLEGVCESPSLIVTARSSIRRTAGGSPARRTADTEAALSRSDAPGLKKSFASPCVELPLSTMLSRNPPRTRRWGWGGCRGGSLAPPLPD